MAVEKRNILGEKLIVAWIMEFYQIKGHFYGLGRHEKRTGGVVEHGFVACRMGEQGVLHFVYYFYIFIFLADCKQVKRVKFEVGFLGLHFEGLRTDAGKKVEGFVMD